VGRRADLDPVEKIEIFCSYRKSSSESSVVQPIASDPKEGRIRPNGRGVSPQCRHAEAGFVVADRSGSLCPRCGWAVRHRSASREPQGDRRVTLPPTAEQSAARRRSINSGAAV
jgi:hypothetical protein